jgi:hypothetical protein
MLFIKQNLNKLISFIAVLHLNFFLALQVNAQDGGFTNPLNVDSFEEFIYIIVRTVMFILFPIVVLMMVYTGFMFVKAQGNPQKIAEARRALMWTIIGGMLVLGAYALAMAVKATIDSITV